MGRIIGIILLGIINLPTLFIHLILTWFIWSGVSSRDAPWGEIFAVLVFAVSFGIEFVKWKAFYHVIKRKKTRWIHFYWVYSGLIFVSFLLALQLHPLVAIPLLYFVSLGLIVSEEGEEAGDHSVDVR